MKKALFLAVFFGMMIAFVPTANAQACCGGSYYQQNPYGSVGNPTDVFSFYQYPIPWYTYFETPNQMARNYYPSNYQPGQYSVYQAPNYSAYNPYGGSRYPSNGFIPSSGNGYGYPQGYGYSSGYNPLSGANSSAPSSFYNPSGFRLSGNGNTFAYVTN